MNRFPRKRGRLSEVLTMAVPFATIPVMILAMTIGLIATFVVIRPVVVI
jgi:hypothetical protein